MLFSVVVPVYNVEKYLTQCLDSILGQSEKDFELILVDDGSVDGSGKICDDYAEKDSRIKVIHKPNGGQTSARKVGVKNARGEYIVPIDSDDWVESSLLHDIKKKIEVYKPDLVSYGFYQALDIGKIISIKTSFESGYYNRNAIEKRILPNLIRGDSGCSFRPGVCGKVIKRNLYEKYQMMVDERIRIGEDLVVVYPCVSWANSIYIMPSQYYYYRVNVQSVTKQRKNGYPWEEVKLIVQSLRKNLWDGYDFEKQINRYYCRRLFNTAKSHLQTKEKYWKVRKDILQHISLSKNRYYIENAEFDGMWQDILAQWALRYKWIFLIKLYAWYETVNRKY